MSPAKSRAAAPKPVPPLTSPSRPRKPTSSERTLDNGLRVVVVRKPGVPLVEVRLRVPFLSAKPKHSARATLLSDTVLSGTDRYDRAGLAAAVQALGGDLTAGVDADRLLLSGNVLATNLAPLLAILADVLTTARYPADEVTRERARLVERLTIARSRAGVVAAEALARRMCGEHPYARELPQVGDVSTVTRSAGAQAACRAGPAGRRRARDRGRCLARRGRSTRSTDARELGRDAAEPAGARAADRRERAAARRRPAGIGAVLACGWAVSRCRRDADAISGAAAGESRSSAATSPRAGPRTSARTRATPTARTAASTTTCSARRWCSTSRWRPRSPRRRCWRRRYELGKIASLPVTDGEVDSVRQYAIGTLALSTATQAGLASTLSASARRSGWAWTG